LPVINFDARLQAAKQLQAQLKLVLDGEPPYDIFVRWKSLSKQAIGWHPDVNDGVRLNIRPFMAEDIPGGKKGAGVLRTKPNIKWDKDRGKEPARDKSEFPWFWGWDEKTQNFAGIGKEPDGNLLTDHFGLVSDFLSECWDQLRRQSRQNVTQGRVHFGGALSGRDTTGVQKTISGLIKLVSPNPATPVADETLEWAVRIALECRRRVKE
jgi:hypothetical protein